MAHCDGEGLEEVSSAGKHRFKSREAVEGERQTERQVERQVDKKKPTVNCSVLEAQEPLEKSTAFPPTPSFQV